MTTTATASAAALDRALPGLDVALDPSFMQACLRANGIAADRVEAHVVRHRIGARCTVRYRVAVGDEQLALYGKVVRTGAEHLALVSDALADASRGDLRLPAIMPVVVFVPSANLVVCPAFSPSVPFHDVALDGDDAVLHRARWSRLGCAIAALHGASVPSLPQIDTSADVRTLRELLVERGLVGSTEPLVQASLGLLDQIEPEVARRRSSAFGPAHGALRTDQVLLGADRFALVDLDGAGVAPAARDIGNLLAYLAWKVIRRTADAGLVAASSTAFESGYAAVADLPARAERHAWQALSMVKIAARRLNAGPSTEVLLVPALLDAAARLTT